MAVWSEISTSSLVGAIRLDAEFWQPKFLDKEKQIRSGNHTHLGALVATFKKGIFFILAREYADQGVPFYRSSNVGAILPNEENIAFITEKKHSEEYKTALTNGDLMIVKTGRSGASVVFDDSCNVSQDVIAVKAIRHRVNPYYLAVFLNTQYGKSEMDRWFQGQVQPHLSLEDARKIWVSLIPDDAQSKIESLVIASATARNNANSAWANAQQLLESELGLDKLRFDKPVGYTARFSELESSLRFDPEHFYPTFKALCESLPEAVSFAPLHRFVQPLKTGIQPTYLEDGQYEVINSKHIGVNKIDTSKLRRAAPAPYSVMADNGDVLLNATGRGTLGRCAVLESDTPRIFDVCIIRIRPVGIDPYFLSALLNTRFGQLQMELHTRGTSGQLHLYPRDARKILIWPAPESLQAEVRDLMIKATRSAQEATQLLDQAKSHVEQLIEEAVRA